MIKFLFSILIGLSLGYLAQRSRMCFVGGIRDYILVKDKILLRGFVSFLLITWIIYSVLFFTGVIKTDIYYYEEKNDSIYISSEYNAEISSSEQEHQNQEVIPDNIIKKIFVFVPNFNLLSLFFLIAGFFVGILSVLANGCPLRQHILAAQGNIDSFAYLAGFYLAVIIYDIFLSRIVYMLFDYIK